MASILRCFLDICVLLAFPSVLVDCADVDLACPDLWTDGARTILTCSIDDNRVTSALCPVLTDTMEFNFRQSGNSVTASQCKVTDYLTQCSATEPGLINTGQCRCYRPAEGRVVFKFALLANKAVHAGGSWNCSTTCLDDLKDLLTYNVASGCSPVQFAVAPPPTSANPPQSSSIQSSSDCQPVDCREHCNNAGCACIIVFLGIVPLIATIALVIYCWILKKRRRAPGVSSASAEETAPNREVSVRHTPAGNQGDQPITYNYNTYNIEKAVFVSPDGLPPGGPSRLMRDNSIEG
ncbi:hypothetical protein BaRGS_00035323 [Batillaria attramentaria]|uniref:Uncharacterized protein n=1 Tax=Batillaria attramentaria TaxID=370345 RepID=A0ABD0JGE2_9CAEN